MVKIGSSLQEAQEVLWDLQNNPPQTVLESLTRLETTASSCMQAFHGNQWVILQSLLEDVLAQTLIAMKMVDIQPDRALDRLVERTRAAVNRQVFHIYADRVEIMVGSERRGGWTLYTQEDYENTLQVAQTLGCNVIHQEACQLDLFQPAHSPPQPE